MMSTFPKLKTTPIREIILGVSYSGSIDVEEINNFRNNEKLKEQFPFSNHAFNTDIEIKNGIDSPSATTKFDGIVLKNDEHNPSMILQVRIGSTSLHVMNKYISFDSLVDTLEGFWKILCLECNLIPKSISVRYLNFIETNNEYESINDYLNIKVTHPFSSMNSKELANIKFEKDGAQVAINCLNGKLDKESGIILDYSIKQVTNMDENSTFASLKGLHKLKNTIFFETLSENTLKRYL